MAKRLNDSRFLCDGYHKGHLLYLMWGSDSRSTNGKGDLPAEEECRISLRHGRPSPQLLSSCTKDLIVNEKYVSQSMKTNMNGCRDKLMCSDRLAPKLFAVKCVFAGCAAIACFS